MLLLLLLLGSTFHLSTSAAAVSTPDPVLPQTLEAAALVSLRGSNSAAD
jgi:hypothetical protein